MTTLRESIATLRNDMREQLTELRGNLEKEKNERRNLEKEVRCFTANTSCRDSATFDAYFPCRSLEEEAERLILSMIIFSEL